VVSAPEIFVIGDPNPIVPFLDISRFAGRKEKNDDTYKANDD